MRDPVEFAPLERSPLRHSRCGQCQTTATHLESPGNVSASRYHYRCFQRTFFEQLTKTFAMCDESDQWFYKILGQQFGPVSFAFLLELSHAGHLPFAAELRQVATDDWIRADAVKGLFEQPAKPSEQPEEQSEVQPAPPDALSSNAESSAEADETAAGTSFWQWLPTITSESIPFWRRLPNIASDEIPLWQGLPTIASNEDVERQKAEEAEQQEWYVRIFGQELGPMPFSRLVVMAEQGELAIGDEVRTSPTNTWVPAEKIDKLSSALLVYQQKAIDDFEQTQVPIDEPSGDLESEDDFELKVSYADETLPASEPPTAPVPDPPDVKSADAPIPAVSSVEPVGKEDAKEEMSVSPVVPPEPEPSVVEASSLPTLTRQEPFSEAANRAEEAPVRPRRAPVDFRVRPNAKERRPDLRTIVAVAACVTIAFVAIIRWQTIDDLAYWSKIDSVWGTLKEQRLKDASDSDQPDVIANTKNELAYLIEELEEHASAEEPAKQNMLWAARDYLQPMLKNSRRHNERAEELFIEQMEIARGLIGSENDD